MTFMNKKVPRKGVFWVVGTLVIAGLIAAGVMANQASAWPTGPKSTTTTVSKSTTTTAPTATGVTLTVHNPQAEIPTGAATALAPRLTDLNGKKILLLTNGKINFDVVLERVADKIKEEYPTVEFGRMKPADRWNLTDEQLEEIVNTYDGYINGIGD